MQLMDPQSKLAEVIVDFAEIVEEGSIGWWQLEAGQKN